MCCGTEAGWYLRLIDSCITQLTAQGPSRTCNESKEEDRDEPRRVGGRRRARRSGQRRRAASRSSAPRTPPSPGGPHPALLMPTLTLGGRRRRERSRASNPHKANAIGPPRWPGKGSLVSTNGTNRGCGVAISQVRILQFGIPRAEMSQYPDSI